jgi:hypothetical protein
VNQRYVFSLSLLRRLLTNNVIGLCGALVFGAMTAVAALGGQAYDVTADFSIANGNPNGAWTYGWSADLTSALNLYPTGTHDSNGDEEWIDQTIVYLDVPRVARNSTDTATQFVPAHSTVFHPGQNGEYSHFVWTSPGDDVLILTASFTPLDSGGTDVHILQDGTSLFSAQVSQGHAQAFSGTITVHAGSRIDFAVGVGADGNFFSDTTGISATLTPTSVATVSGTSNIYGAGHASPPGGGDLPPVVKFTAGPGQYVTFASVTGQVRFDTFNDDHGNGSTSPDGGSFLAPTDISATAGLSEIKAPTTEALLGVFLSDAEPADPAPAALDFGPGALTENFDSISPKIGQVFFIGDGKTTGGNAQKFYAPANATRLYLGVADAFNGSSITGSPASWGDDGGQYSIQVEVINNDPTAPPHGGLSATNFTVNESSSPVYPPVGAPVNGLADTVLRFAAQQTGIAANETIRVQATTTPSVESSWTDLANASAGRMVFDVTTHQFVLSSNDYPYQQADPVYFRAVTSAGGYSDSISNVVGPFNLTSNKPRMGSTALHFTGNGPIADFYFKAVESAVPSGIAIRVQATTTPADEATWRDLSNGHAGAMTQSIDPTQFLLLVNNYPTTAGIYFRAVASAPGFVDSISNLVGPYDVTQTIPPVVSITPPTGLPNSGSGASIDSPILVTEGTFNVSASAQTNRAVKKLALQLDGQTKFELTDGSKHLDYVLGGIPLGDHVLEVVAVDDLGARARAATGATYIRVVPAPSALKAARSVRSGASAADSTGKIYAVINSGGSWDDPATWIDATGNPGVPGPDDFAVIGNASVKFGLDRTVKSLSINGGHLLGPGIVTILGIMTFTAGTVEDNVGIVIRSGAVLQLNNPTDLQFNPGSNGRGHIFNAGTCNIHGSAGIIGADYITNDGTINWLPSIEIPLNASIDPNAALRSLQANTFTNGGIISGDLPHLIGSDSAGLIGHDSSSLIGHDSSSLVAAGGGNVIATDSAGLIGSDSAGLISEHGAGVVSAGGGNCIAAGGGNFRAFANARADSAPAGFTQSGGEIDLNAFNIIGPVTLNGGTLTGSGFIQGDLANNGGYILPGHSTGAIGVLGTFSQGANGTLIIETGGPSSLQFEQLQVRDAANLNGKLDVRLINGYTPDPADTFNPLGYSSVSGSFSSVSSNAQVTVTSNGLLTAVNPNVPGPSTGQPLNIATRMSVQAGDNVLIAGFIVTGPSGSTKKVLIRGLGPSLAHFGVPNTLSDPLLELHTSNGTVSNDDWQQGDTSQIPNGFAPSDPHEAVIVATLAPGNYSAVVKGAHGETGVGIAELYDLDSTSPAKLANISTRGFINTGDDVMIGGFIVGGTEPARILVRAIGPTLTDFGVQGALADPTLELHDSNGTSISNDDWRESQEAAIIATTIPPNKDREPAILATLVPGNYTAVVRGKDNTTGVGLVEAYNLQ